MRLSIVCLIVLLLGNFSFSAIFKLKNGSTLSGKIVSSNANNVTIEDERGNATTIQREYFTVSPETQPVPLPAKNETVIDTGPVHHVFGISFLHGREIVDRWYYNSYLSFNYINSVDMYLEGVTFAYEFLFIPWVSVGACVSLGSFDNSLRVLNDIYFIVHPFTATGFDPYIGVGIINEYAKREFRFVFDFPVKIGVNYWLVKHFGIRVQAESWLKSWFTRYYQFSGGIVLAF